MARSTQGKGASVNKSGGNIRTKARFRNCYGKANRTEYGMVSPKSGRIARPGANFAAEIKDVAFVFAPSWEFACCRRRLAAPAEKGIAEAIKTPCHCSSRLSHTRRLSLRRSRSTSAAQARTERKWRTAAVMTGSSVDTLVARQAQIWSGGYQVPSDVVGGRNLNAYGHTREELTLVASLLGVPISHCCELVEGRLPGGLPALTSEPCGTNTM